MNNMRSNLDQLFGKPITLSPVDPPDISSGILNTDGDGKGNSDNVWVWWIVGAIAILIGRAYYIDYKNRKDERGKGRQ
jgi:hypothetical protein